MAGSPPLPPRRPTLPPKQNLDASDAEHGSSGYTGQDVFGGSQLTDLDESFGQDKPSLNSYDQLLPPQPPAPYSMPDRPAIREAPDFSSSQQQQRRIKGSVASACVPCKRAHLR